MGSLDDPRAAQVDELAYEAELADRRGEVEQARRLYAKAAAVEAEIARSAPASEPRVRGLLAVSATALWYKASRHDEVERLACEFLSDPTSLAEQARVELRGLMESAWRERDLAQAFGDADEAAPLIVKLADGGSQEFRIDPAQFAETIGPKVNRRVRVLGERTRSIRRRRTEPLLPRAIDVVLLDDPS